MKKLLIIILLLFNISLFADNDYELKFYEKVLPLIFNAKHLIVYSDSKTKDILKHSKVFLLTDDCNKANLLIGKKFDNIPNSCDGIPIFSTCYSGYKNMQNSFGAFYWRKGRPQLKFKKDKFQELNLHIPHSLEKYVK